MAVDWGKALSIFDQNCTKSDYLAPIIQKARVPAGKHIIAHSSDGNNTATFATTR